MTDQRPEPRIPARTRLLRPVLFEDEASGRLSPAAFKAYLGIATRSDDAGYLPWRPARIAAGIWPYDPAARRERELLRLAADLVAAGLPRLFDCGCAFLPRLVEDLAVKGGDKTTAIEAYHAGCAVALQSAPDADVGLRSATGQSVPSSSSWSVNESGSQPSSESVEGSAPSSLSEPGSSGARPRPNGKARRSIVSGPPEGGEPSSNGTTSEARMTLERFADLLAPGRPWDEAGGDPPPAEVKRRLEVLQLRQGDESIVKALVAGYTAGEHRPAHLLTLVEQLVLEGARA